MVVLNNIIIIILTIGLSYLFGSISNAIIWTNKYNGVDIRSLGSKNAGFTNVIRTIGGKSALYTFIGDFLKGVISVLIGKFLFSNFLISDMDSFLLVQIGAYLAGLSCVIGHIYPCFFQFKGGKGVLTTASVICMIDWRVFLICIGIFIILMIITRIVSLSSICAATALPITTFLITFFIDYYPNKNSLDSPSLAYIAFSTGMSLIIAFYIVYKHRSNISRLINGTEQKLVIKNKNTSSKK